MNELEKVENHIPKRLWIAIVLLLFFINLMVINTVQATPSVDDLPYRPPVSEPKVKLMGHIRLDMAHSPDIKEGYWTVVQWKNHAGQWYDTSGWQGEFDENGYVSWTVGDEHSRSTPFRWLVFSNESRTELIFTSEDFYLPTADNKLVQIQVVAQETANVIETRSLSKKMNGGMIQLHGGAQAAGSSELWTVVQWLNPDTQKWIEVSGWQGHFDADGEVEWYVASSSLGKGPFRWVIKDGGKVVRTSEQFSLPSQSGNVVAVTVNMGRVS